MSEDNRLPPKGVWRTMSNPGIHTDTHNKLRAGDAEYYRRNPIPIRFSGQSAVRNERVFQRLRVERAAALIIGSVAIKRGGVDAGERGVYQRRQQECADDDQQ